MLGQKQTELVLVRCACCKSGMSCAWIPRTFTFRSVARSCRTPSSTATARRISRRRRESSSSRACAARAGRRCARAIRWRTADAPSRNRKEECMATDEKSAAIRFGEIASEIKANAEWRRLLAGEYADEIKALDEIAKRYGGESWNTGGGIHVGVIPLWPHDAM